MTKMLINERLVTMINQEGVVANRDVVEELVMVRRHKKPLRAVVTKWKNLAQEEVDYALFEMRQTL